VESGEFDASAALSFMSIGHVVPLSNEVAEAGVLTPNSDAGKALKDIVRNVEKSLTTKRKKRVIIWKAPQQLA
jgi:hypothetical protein